MAATAADLISHKTAGIHSIPSTTTISEALTQLASLRVGALLIIDDDHLAGLVSERDLVRHLGQGGAMDAPVMLCGSTDLTTITPDTLVTRCMQLMTEERIRHLPVLDDETIVGVVSIGDVVRHQLQAKDFLLDQYGQYFGDAAG